LIQILTYALKEKRTVVSTTLIPIAILPWYARDSGFTKLDVTPGGGLDAGTRVGVGVAIFPLKIQRSDTVLRVCPMSTALVARPEKAIANAKFRSRSVEFVFLTFKFV
jgi:hypothetical protein